MTDDYFIKNYELLCRHYYVQNDSMEKGRNFSWLIESALFIGWFKLSCPILKLLIIIIGTIFSISWFIVFKRFRKSMDFTTTSLIEIENKYKDFPNRPNIFTRENMTFKGKHFSSQRFWWDELHPLLFLFAWFFLIYPFCSLLSYFLILFAILFSILFFQD